MKAILQRKAHFIAAHRLFNPIWSDEKNAGVFGKCSNPNYHGHNYELIVSVSGSINPDTGMIMNVKALKDVIFEEVELPFDHKNLNLEVPEFETLIPTAENIARVIWEKIRKRLDRSQGLEVTLYETPRIFVTYNGDA